MKTKQIQKHITSKSIEIIKKVVPNPKYVYMLKDLYVYNRDRERKNAYGDRNMLKPKVLFFGIINL